MHPQDRPVYVPLPKTPEGRIDKDKVKEQYMASEHLTWAAFAREYGYDPKQAKEFPSKRWKGEKKKKLASKSSEELKDLLFEHKGRWHQDVLKTLKNYPAAHDAIMMALSQAIREVQVLAQEAQQLHPKDLAKQGLLSKVKISDLVGLSVAVKTVTESKYKSLMLSEWSVKLTEEQASPEGAKQQAEDKTPGSTWNIKLIGKEVDDIAFDKMVQSYYDKPQRTDLEGTDG